MEDITEELTDKSSVVIFDKVIWIFKFEILPSKIVNKPYTLL